MVEAVRRQLDHFLHTSFNVLPYESYIAVCEKLNALESFFWPPGYPILFALISLVAGPIPLAGQAVSLVMGALVPVFTTLLVRELWPQDRPLALLSGGELAPQPSCSAGLSPARLDGRTTRRGLVGHRGVGTAGTRNRGPEAKSPQGLSL